MENNINTDQTEFVSVNSVMAMYKISRPTIEKKIQRGSIVKYRVEGSNRIYLKRSQVQEAFEPKILQLT